MAPEHKLARSVDNSIAFAHLSCLIFGVVLLLWGAAPAVFERMQTGSAPPLSNLLASLPEFLIGAAFIVLHALIRARIRWAVWIGFFLAVLFVGTGLAHIVLSGGRTLGTFVLLLSAQAAAATWLAIDALARQAAAEELAAGSLEANASDDSAPTVAGP